MENIHALLTAASESIREARAQLSAMLQTERVSCAYSDAQRVDERLCKIIEDLKDAKPT